MAMQGQHVLVDHIISVLFLSDKNRITEWIDRIVVMNQEANKCSDNAFSYMGRFYRASHVIGPISRRQELHSSLTGQVDMLLRDQKIIDDQKAFIRQAIVQLLDPCYSVQDLRDALPDCLVSCVPTLSGFQRTRAEAYTIEDNPRAMKQYKQMLPNIQTYAAIRLI